MIKGKSPDYIKKMSDSIYEALVEAYQMAERTICSRSLEQLEPGDLIYDRHFGIKGSRSGDFVIINIESDARRRGEKVAFLARLSDKLAASPGIARDDVFVRLSMTAGLEDWSLGKWYCRIEIVGSPAWPALSKSRPCKRIVNGWVIAFVRLFFRAETMTLKIRQVTDKRGRRICLSGQLRSEHLDELKSEVERGGARVALDLGETRSGGYRRCSLSKRV